MSRWTLMEIAGVALIAVALAAVHVALAVGAVGVYLLAVGIIGEQGQEASDG